MLHDVVENTPLLSIRLASVGPAHRVDVSRVLRRQPNVTAPHFDSTGTCRPLCANSGHCAYGRPSLDPYVAPWPRIRVHLFNRIRRQAGTGLSIAAAPFSRLQPIRFHGGAPGPVGRGSGVGQGARPSVRRKGVGRGLN
jgi:hypothetical protein